MLYVDLSNTAYGVIIVQTLRKYFEGFTDQEVDKVKITHKLQGIVGHTS